MIEEIRARINEGRFEFSKHAVDQSLLRQISVQELREAIAGYEPDPADWIDFRVRRT